MGATTRKDALRSRRAILAAAEQVLADRPEASFAEIAHAAGVGQATVYRHFADRQALLAAHAEAAVARLAATVGEPDAPDSFERLLRAMVAEQVRFQGLSTAIRRGEVDESRIERLSGRVRELFAAPLAAAQEAGRLRAELGVDDALLVLGMIDGVLGGLTDPGERERTAARTIELVLDGLR